MANGRLAVAAASLLFAGILLAQLTEQDKNRQTLNLPKDPPLVAVGDASRLVFHVSPLSGQGLLSDQTRAALKAILKLNGGAPLVHIRAFSAGNGDVRRIPQIVSDALGNKSGPLPSVSVLQIGALPLHDAQVVLETVSVGKKDVNKGGLVFHPAETVVGTEQGAEVKTLLQHATDQLSAKMQGGAALSVTCFVSDLEGAAELQRIVAAAFPGAAMNLVQSRRLAWQTEASCEGVSRGSGAPSGTQAARIAFTGTQVAFGITEKDAAVAVQRLDRGLVEAAASGTANAALVRFYLLSPATAGVALKQLSGPAAVATFSVEGVGPASAGFAIDAVSPVR